MTKEVLLALALTFPSADQFKPERAVDEVLSVTTDDTESRVLIGFGYFESHWGQLMLGDCTCTEPVRFGTLILMLDNDCPNLSKRTLKNCRAIGPMQTWDPERWLEGATPAKVVADRVLGYRVGLAIFRRAMEKCGSNVRAALGFYASGKACGFAADLVAQRCKRIGC